MGQTPNKTYTAPDGSVYRVEADGTLTKIKSGRVQSNEPPSKYQIAPDGKIYRIESDGSVTYLGNAEDRQSPSQYTPAPYAKKSSHKWVWAVILVIIVAAVACVMYVASNNSTFNSYNSSYNEAYPSQNENTAQSSEYEEQNQNASSNDMPADNDAQYAFIVDGEYYGTIGNARIHGNLTLDTENPSGVLYYSDNGNGEALVIYGECDGKTWYEYYNSENTGRIDFSYWDTTGAIKSR